MIEYKQFRTAGSRVYLFSLFCQPIQLPRGLKSKMFIFIKVSTCKWITVSWQLLPPTPQQRPCHCSFCRHLCICRAPAGRCAEGVQPFPGGAYILGRKTKIKPKKPPMKNYVKYWEWSVLRSRRKLGKEEAGVAGVCISQERGGRGSQAGGRHRPRALSGPVGGP